MKNKECICTEICLNPSNCPIKPKKIKIMKQELPQFGTKEFNDLANQYCGGKPKKYSKYLSCCRSEEECSCKEEPSTKLHKGEVVDESYPKEFKQETLEEAARNHQKGNYDWQNEKRLSFIAGAKWQEERSYSEEDMRGMYNKSCGLIGLGLLDNQTENNSRFKELLEQFKKK